MKVIRLKLVSVGGCWKGVLIGYQRCVRNVSHVCQWCI